nr:MAG TPA: hypothetical protein [Caudoviricetes sp.]
MPSVNSVAESPIRHLVSVIQTLQKCYKLKQIIYRNKLNTHSLRQKFL